MTCCCRCNGSNGRCIKCICVRSGKRCRGCLPQRLGICTNTGQTQSMSDAPVPQPAQASRPSQPEPSQQLSTSPPVSVSDEAPLDAPIPLGSNSPIDAPQTFHHTLPAYTPMSPSVFTWGEYNAIQFSAKLEDAYKTVIHWRKNCFTPPSGRAGKDFVNELSRLYLAFGTASALESIALRATIVLPHLLLQKPHRKSKNKDNIACLDRRMALWKEGDLDQLIEEGRAIQSRLFKQNPLGDKNSDKNTARSFAKLMFAGKCKAALDLLSNNEKSALLHLDDPSDPQEPNAQSVKDVLISKHPAAQEVHEECIMAGEPEDPHPIIFESIKSELIRSCALKTTGAAGPSGLDAHIWRRLCISFKEPSRNLCESLATVARRLCSEYVDPESVAPLLACRLIALNKNPGVRPIGVGDVARRIITKAIIQFAKDDIQQACGCQQLCGGQLSGIEAGVHATRDMFEADKEQAALLVDASNAFNSLNRQVALHNIRRMCPVIARVLINTYRNSTELFVEDNSLLSQEGTTQGDPLAMAMYGLATIPLIRKLDGHCKQVWYADDSAAIGPVDRVKHWWDTLVSEGPKYGYYPNSSKTWLIVKESHLANAYAAFANTGVNITAEGRPYLGAAIGTKDYVEEYMGRKVGQWVSMIEKLSSIASSQPHAAYSALTHGLLGKWTYLTRVTPNISHLLQPLDDCLRSKLIPVLTGRPPPNDTDLSLYSLPARLGGLGIPILSAKADKDLQSSLFVCKPLLEGIISQDHTYRLEMLSTQLENKRTVRSSNNIENTRIADELHSHLSGTLQRSMDLAREKGASSWLTTLPLSEHGFTLHKSAFRDAMALRYGWIPKDIPSKCECGKAFSVEHALSCAKGGFPILRHNEIRDLTATLLTEVCHDVQIEPELQPLTGESLTNATANTHDGARLDISANGLWGGRLEKTYLDVRIFNPLASSNRHYSLATCYTKHEREKKRTYEQRVREIEHASFTPLVLSSTGGMGREATTFYKRMASLLSVKWNNPYSKTLNWLRCRLSFSLLRSSILAIRGARSSRGNAITPASVELASEESRLMLN